QGLLPDPACTVGINTPCDAQVLSTQVMAELSGVPFFPVDVPYYHNEETILHVDVPLAPATAEDFKTLLGEKDDAD
ncbi:MAG: 2-hydroxyacyl-CoA dehydratase, partial [bacterium]|nr:2-hydroxyacyl-CoA dehydratase [bacterium]